MYSICLILVFVSRDITIVNFKWGTRVLDIPFVTKKNLYIIVVKLCYANIC